MTDRVSAFIVVLDRDIRIDDAESTISALKCIKGVLAVEPVVSDANQAIIEARIHTDIGNKLYDFIRTNLR